MFLPLQTHGGFISSDGSSIYVHYIWLIFTVNAGKHIIHGSYEIWIAMFILTIFDHLEN